MNTQSQADALDQTPLSAGERAKFWREPRYRDLECLSASFRTHAYELHTHETYVIGSISAGCERFSVDGVNYAARRGDLCMLHPDAVHDGEPEGEGYAYRMIYPSIGLLAELAHDLTGKAPRGTPGFPAPVVHDPELSEAFIAAHRAMEARGAALEADEAMVNILGRILVRHGRIAVPDGKLGEPGAVGRARDYLAANVTENVDLATLAHVAGLSRSHLIRAFKKSMGLTPHAFLVDRRVRLARTLLLEGQLPAEAALASGFADQAHMTRAFKARIGITPGRFARMV